MIYGIEQSTDLRDRRTVIKKFSSESAALKWRDKNNGELTYGDPEGARNYHHTFKSVWIFEGRVPKKKINEAMRRSTSTYRTTRNDAIAGIVTCNGIEVE